MSHRNTPEKELEVQLELYLGIGTFSEIGSSNPKNQKKFFALKSLKMVRNGAKRVQKVFFFVFFGASEFLEIFRFFSSK